MRNWNPLILLCLAFLVSKISSAEQCGRQAGGALCPNRLCCSEFGWCGSTDAYCKNNCQSQCAGSSPNPTPTPTPTTPTTGGNDLGSIITPSLFQEMLKHRNDQSCKGRGFYTYNAFITAARSFPGFGTTGNTDIRKREIAAFFGQTSQETTGGWPTAPDGQFAWGYCFLKEENQEKSGNNFCTSNQFPCPAGRRYYGRGPIQLTHNYNYARAGRAIGADLINNPDLIVTDATVSFKTAIWFWMTAQDNKPSPHDVITGRWTPSAADRAAGRVPGYGVITNIINGGIECGQGPNDRVKGRIGFYQRYCNILRVGFGDNLDCYNQRSFAS